MGADAIASLFQIINLILLFGWLILTVLTLLHLRKQNLPASPLALWTLIILIPWLGALAYWLIRPADND